MLKEFRRNGWAYIGWRRTLWPFTRLKVTSEEITLRTILIGKYEFSPSEVVSVEKCKKCGKLVFGSCTKIIHNRKEYPRDIHFWCFSKPEEIAEKIMKSGFFPRGVIPPDMEYKGYPVRWQSLLLLGLFCSLALIMDKSGALKFVAVLAIFLISTLIWKSEFIERAIMIPGHKPTEIKIMLFVTAILTGFILCVTVYETIV